MTQTPEQIDAELREGVFGCLGKAIDELAEIGFQRGATVIYKDTKDKYIISGFGVTVSDCYATVKLHVFHAIDNGSGDSLEDSITRFVVDESGRKHDPATVDCRVAARALLEDQKRESEA